MKNYLHQVGLRDDLGRAPWLLTEVGRLKLNEGGVISWAWSKLEKSEQT